MLNQMLKSFKTSKDINSMNSIIDYYRIERSDEEVLQLAETLAYSGFVLDKSPLSADIPSTGGPSSLSTLLGPLFLYSIGFEVRKLGVSGRPAGGIDVLSQLNGYRTEFSAADINHYIENGIRYIHFESGGQFAPLDALLFGYRRKVNAVNVPQLAIASLLSKKIAVGLSFVNLDVRASHLGNFGSSYEKCVNNSMRFCSIASLAGIKACCTVSDASIPYQPFIGRREALIAIHRLLYGNSNEWLDNHYNLCANMANELVIIQSGNKNNKALSSITKNKVKEAFEHNIIEQGSSLDEFFEKVLNSGKEIIIVAPYDGWIEYDLESIRRDIVSIQSNGFQLSNSSKYPDPMGIELLAKPGSYVQKGEEIIKLRIRTDNSFSIQINNWFTLYPEKTKSIYDRKVEVI